MGKISAEKTRSLAVKIGQERGAGIYLDTRCEKRQSFSIAEIKNILYLLSEGYEEVNFEVINLVLTHFLWSLVRSQV